MCKTNDETFEDFQKQRVESLPSPISEELTGDLLEKAREMEKNELLFLFEHGEDSVSARFIQESVSPVKFSEETSGVRYDYPHSKLLKWKLVFFCHKCGETYEAINENTPEELLAF